LVISSKPSYLAAGNDPNWLLCEGGGKRFTTDRNASACELKFWLEKPGPRERPFITARRYT
jgi:hypothetical protein